MKRCIAVIAMLALAAPALAQENQKTPSPQPSDKQTAAVTTHGQLGMTGQVLLGDLAPDFELDGSHGAPVQLSHLRGDWVLLVFADRRDHITPLRSIDAQMRAAGVRLVGICHEKARTLDNYAARDSVPLMLADVTGEIATMYGLYDSAHRATVPGFFVLDRDGTVRIAFLGQRLPPEEIARLTQFAVVGF